MFGAIQLKMLHVKNGEASREGQAGAQDLLGAISSGPHFRWDTCLRTVAIFPDHPDFDLPRNSSTEVLAGEVAYEKLLELICGLHSPMVGETEVFGQFKEAVQKFQSSESVLTSSTISTKVHASAFHQAFRAWANGLLEDAKLIRRTHLQDLGSQSYGSLVRRELRDIGSASISILGAGRLVADILPWISKRTDRTSNHITVHCRDQAKALHALRGYIAPGASLLLEGLLDPQTIAAKPLASHLPSVLLIAAPMSGSEIKQWVAKSGRKFDLVLDLRSDSAIDAVEFPHGSLSGRYVSLEEFFRTINDTKAAASKRREVALLAVRGRLQEREAMAYHRPFGWDDV